MTASALVLGDGRRLAFREYGDAAGTPVLAFHGTPSSSAESAHLAAAAARCGIRLVAPDRPGFGGSDPQPGRRLLDWPRDAAALADALALDRFAVVGVSGGGPYALACAVALPGRVSAVALVSALVPHTDPVVAEALAPALGQVFAVARDNPAALDSFYGFLLDPAPAEVPHTGTPGSDEEISTRPGARAIFAQMRAEGVTHGLQSVCQEMALHAGPWGFGLDDVHVPVAAWHGEDDSAVPVAALRALAARHPALTLNVRPGGHLFSVDAADEILASLVAAQERVAS